MCNSCSGYAFGDSARAGIAHHAMHTILEGTRLNLLCFFPLPCMAQCTVTSLTAMDACQCCADSHHGQRCCSVPCPVLTAVGDVVQHIKADGIEALSARWAQQGPAETARQLRNLGEQEAAALFTALGPETMGQLIRGSGPDFAPQLFLALGAPFAGTLLSHAGNEFSAGLFKALGIEFMVAMLHQTGAQFLSEMMNAAGPATAAGTFKTAGADFASQLLKQLGVKYNVQVGKRRKRVSAVHTVMIGRKAW